MAIPHILFVCLGALRNIVVYDNLAVEITDTETPYLKAAKRGAATPS